MNLAIFLIAVVVVGFLLMMAGDRLPLPWRYLVYAIVVILLLVWLARLLGVA